MLRTVGVFLVAAVLAMVIIATSVYIIAYLIPQHFDPYFFLLVTLLAATATGLIVGSLQPNRAGLLAVVCLLPCFILEIQHPLQSGTWRTPSFVLFVLAQTLGLGLAFWVARWVSDRRKRIRLSVPNS